MSLACVQVVLTTQLDKDMSRAIELWSEAADLGSASALFERFSHCHHGLLEVSQDKAKGIRCWELGAMRKETRSADTALEVWSWKNGTISDLGQDGSQKIGCMYGYAQK